MCFNEQSQDVEITLPAKGVDRGTVRAKQPPGTIPDCRNIRALDIRGRVGCGKRSGLAQAFDRAASVGARRITALARLTEAVGTTTSTGAYVDVTEGFTTQAATSPTDFGLNWVYGSVDANGLSETSAAVFGITTDASVRKCVDFSGSSQFYAMMVDYKTTNDVTMTAFTSTQATAPGNPNPNGPTDQPTSFGPFVRGNGVGSKLLGFRFIRNGADHNVVGQIISWSGGAVTVLATSSNQALLASATIAASALSVHLFETGTGVTADVSWPGSLTASGNMAFTLSATVAIVNDIDGLPSTCAGVHFLGALGNWSSATKRKVHTFRFTKIVPAATEVAAQYLGTSSPSPTPQAFFVNDGWTTFSRVVGAASTVTSDVGYAESASSGVQRIDRDNDKIIATSDSGTLKHAGVYRTSDDTRYGVEFRLLSGLTTETDRMGFLLRFAPATAGSATINENLQVKIGASRTAQGTTTKLATNASGAMEVVFQNGSVSGASATALTTVATTATFCYRIDDWVRCVDTGSILLVTINGRPIYTLSNSTFSANVKNGAGAITTAGSGGAYGFRLFAIEDSQTRVGEVRSKILVCGNNTCDVGILNNLGLNRCSGGGFANALPSFFAFNLKWYGVDGDRNRIINPADFTVSDWSTAVTAGSLPVGCHLAALYRGRAVLARTDDNPSIWYMSRVFNPLDWDYGADPLQTAPFAGTNADVGVPGDAITALIPFSDDYLIFGCATSIWMMEGDPGYGGAVQNLSYKTGMISNRAWCFDEKGNLWFMGLGGLYILPRGSRDPQNVSGRRLATYLDELDSDTILVQMAYDAFKKYVHVFLTNTDTTIDSIHVVYDLQLDAFFFDSLPGRADPWAVCDIVGTAFEDRRILLGGDDGYTRRFRDDVAYDIDTSSADETATLIHTIIDSWVRFAPLDANGRKELLCVGIQSQGSFDNGAVTYEVLAANTVEDLSNQDLGDGVVNGTIFGNGLGQQRPQRIRVRGGAQQLIIRQQSTTDGFKIEKIVMHYRETGQRNSA